MHSNKDMHINRSNINLDINIYYFIADVIKSPKSAECMNSTSGHLFIIAFIKLSNIFKLSFRLVSKILPINTTRWAEIIAGLFSLKARSIAFNVIFVQFFFDRDGSKYTFLIK